MLESTFSTQFSGLMDQLGARFSRRDLLRQAESYLRGLLSQVERKNSWQLAEAAGADTPHGFQRLLGRARWNADEVRDDLQRYVVEHLGDSDGVLIIDETGFLKKGNKSAGVSRQYSGTAGRIENSQIGVFMAYRSDRGHALVDRELYLPKCWTEDRQRSGEAGIPEDTGFATKPVLARRMLRRAIEECFEQAKQETGLDEYEVRSWTGWYRHITLSMFAQAFLSVVRSKSNPRSRSKKKCWRRVDSADSSRGTKVALPTGLSTAMPST